MACVLIEIHSIENHLNKYRFFDNCYLYNEF